MKKLLKDKKLIIDILLIFLITCLALWSYFTNNLLAGDDIRYHLNRIVGVSDAFKEGQILPKIYPYTNSGFGYASPLFYCDLFIYPFALIYILGIGAVPCFKLMVFTYSFIGNVFVYTIFKKETNKRHLGLLAALLYEGANYHLQNIFIRSALGEILAMSFIPIVLYAIYKILIKKEDAWIYLGVSFSLLVMSHLITSVLYAGLFLILIIAFVVVNRKEKEIIKKMLITILKGTLLALLICAWYIFPMLEQMLSQDFNYSYDSGMPNITEIIEPVRNSIGLLFHTNIIRYNGSIGIILNIFLLISFFRFKNVYISTITILCSICYLIIWGILPAGFLSIIQFYFRLYIIIFPLAVIVTIYYLNRTQIKYFKLINILIILYTLFNLANANYEVLTIDYINRGYLSNDLDIYKENAKSKEYYTNLDKNWDVSELGNGEYLPHSEHTNFNKLDSSIYFLDKDNCLIECIKKGDYSRNYSTIIFTCNNSDDASLIIPLSYYKGYRVYELINDNWESTECVSDQTYKLIRIESSIGEHTYKITYKGTIVQYTSLVVSIISVIGIIIYKYKRKQLA